MEIKREIIVCDDSEGILAGFKSMLERDFNVTVVHVEKLLFDELRSSKKFDVLFLDVGLGHTCGIDVLIKVKAEFPQFNVVMMTGHEDDVLEAEAFKYGAGGFFIKPFKSKDIIECIHRLAGH